MKNKQTILAIPFLAMLVFALAFISAVDVESMSQSMYPQSLYKPITITQGGDNGTDSFTWCNLTTVRYPNQSIIVSNEAMTSSSGEFSYTLGGDRVIVSGSYTAYGFCDGHSFKFDIPVNPTGMEQTSLLNNPILLIFLILATILLVLAFYMKNAPVGFTSGVMFILSGVYTMIYGFNNYTDMYTRAAGLVLISLGAIFTVAAGYEWIIDASQDSGMMGETNNAISEEE